MLSAFSVSLNQTIRCAGIYKKTILEKTILEKYE